jgi:hypothetical protein
LNGIENTGAPYPPATAVPNNFANDYQFTATGSAVPEPGSLAMGAIGLLGYVTLIRPYVKKIELNPLVLV